MHLKLTRTGGFAGITPPPVEVDTSLLSIKDAKHVESLVAGAKFFGQGFSFTCGSCHQPRSDQRENYHRQSNDGSLPGKLPFCFHNNQPLNFFAAIVELCPPKPNELFTMAFTGISRATLGT